MSLVLVVVATAPARASWTSHPWLTLNAGYENDRFPDPVRDRFALPGGSLVGVTPGVWMAWRPGGRTSLDLNGQLGYERFRNQAERSVLGSVASGEVRVQVAPSWQWRSMVAVNYYRDSAYDIANRAGGGIELGFGTARPRWSLEAFAGMDGRRYGNLVAYDDEGVPGTYTETGVSLGVGGQGWVGRRAVFAGRLSWLRTDSRDSLYDGDSWLGQGSVRASGPLGLSLTLGALGQRRVFDSRPSALEAASYWQVGAGLERALGPTLGLAARYAFARSTDPLYANESLHRVTLAATWGLGASARATAEVELPMPVGPQAPPLREMDGRVFRCHAPSAQAVSLVGDFNGWDPAAHALRPGRDGWWQTEVRLPAGSHQYAYLVDGLMVAPADADAIVDDGFGGRNGLILVAPGGP